MHAHTHMCTHTHTHTHTHTQQQQQQQQQNKNHNNNHHHQPTPPKKKMGNNSIIYLVPPNLTNSHSSPRVVLSCNTGTWIYTPLSKYKQLFLFFYRLCSKAKGSHPHTTQIQTGVSFLLQTMQQSQGQSPSYHANTALQSVGVSLSISCLVKNIDVFVA